MTTKWSSYPSLKELDAYFGTTVMVSDFNIGDIIRGTILGSLLLISNIDIMTPSGVVGVKGIGLNGRILFLSHNSKKAYKRVFTAKLLELWSKENGREKTTPFKTAAPVMCSLCNVELEWAYMAERCPECWRVYTGG